MIPPISVPVRPHEVLSSVLARPERASGFREALKAATGLPHLELHGSGQAGLASVLRAWAADGRDEVLVPAYTCWTVPAAVVRAGLRVRLYDVDPHTLAPDPSALARAPLGRVAAAVFAHLFDRTCDVPALARVVRAADPTVRVLEDSAQAWPRGTDADAVLLSFGRGKPLPLGGGGALATREAGSEATSTATAGGFGEALSLVATTVLGRSSWYRLPASLPFLRIGTTVFDPAFEADRPMWGWQERLGSRLVPHLDALSRRRAANALRIGAPLLGIPGCHLPLPAGGSGPIRLPVLAPSRDSRDAAIRSLLASGITATSMYPGTLADIAALRPHLAVPDEPIPGAREVAARLLTLPVYPTLDADEVERIATSAERALGAGAR
jgi:dTDP-4-amino-4,6-dideoxygalactose transaminase